MAKSQVVNFDGREEKFRKAVARYQETKVRDDYEEAERLRLRLRAGYITHRDEIAASLQDDRHLAQHDRTNLQAISDRCTTRIQELDQPIAR